MNVLVNVTAMTMVGDPLPFEEKEGGSPPPLWVFLDSSFEMGFWSLKWMESMDLVPSRFCFLASSNTLFWTMKQIVQSQKNSSYVRRENKTKQRES
jgi:hypothetical protein